MNKSDTSKIGNVAGTTAGVGISSITGIPPSVTVPVMSAIGGFIGGIFGKNPPRKIESVGTGSYASGGMVKYSAGSMTEYRGKPHEGGGIKTEFGEVEDGETQVMINNKPYIFSNRLKVPGTNKTFAQVSKEPNINLDTLAAKQEQISGRNKGESNSTEYAYGGVVDPTKFGQLGLQSNLQSQEELLTNRVNSLAKGKEMTQQAYSPNKSISPLPSVPKNGGLPHYSIPYKTPNFNYTNKATNRANQLLDNKINNENNQQKKLDNGSLGLQSNLESKNQILPALKSKKQISNKLPTELIDIKTESLANFKPVEATMKNISKTKTDFTGLKNFGKDLIPYTGDIINAGRALFEKDNIPKQKVNDSAYRKIPTHVDVNPQLESNARATTAMMSNPNATATDRALAMTSKQRADSEVYATKTNQENNLAMQQANMMSNIAQRQEAMDNQYNQAKMATDANRMNMLSKSIGDASTRYQSMIKDGTMNEMELMKMDAEIAGKVRDPKEKLALYKSFIDSATNPKLKQALTDKYNSLAKGI